jgi:hypothetical protein
VHDSEEQGGEVLTKINNQHGQVEAELKCWYKGEMSRVTNTEAVENDFDKVVTLVSEKIKSKEVDAFPMLDDLYKQLNGICTVKSQCPDVKVIGGSTAVNIGKLQIDDILMNTTADDHELFHEAISLLQSIVTESDIQGRMLLGSVGLVSCVMTIIKSRLTCKMCDPVMVESWAILVRAVDETSQHCAEFISEGGMPLSLSCMNAFSNNDELIQNVLRVIAYIAEVHSLHNLCFNVPTIPTLICVLKEQSKSPIISFAICSALAHFVSEGPNAWM